MTERDLEIDRLRTENERLREERQYACGEARSERGENARLRMELAKGDKAYAVVLGQLDRLRGELRDSHKVAEHYMNLAAGRLDALERVRALAGDSDESWPRAIRDALDGEQPTT